MVLEVHNTSTLINRNLDYIHIIICKIIKFFLGLNWQNCIMNRVCFEGITKLLNSRIWVPNHAKDRSVRRSTSMQLASIILVKIYAENIVEEQM